MAFILTHFESNVKTYVSTVELPFQYQTDLKPNQDGNLSTLGTLTIASFCILKS